MALLIIVILCIAAVWILGGAFASFSAVPLSGWRRGLLVVGRLLMVSGAIGFFGNGLSAAGGLNWLPDSFEWPAGSTSGVITTPAGFHVAPLQPSGRVQIYDRDWHFVRGWHVAGSGKHMHVSPAEGERFHVVTAGSRLDTVFDTQGQLISREIYPATSRPTFANEGEDHFIPTRPWLLLFSSPFLSAMSMIAGMATIMLLTRTERANAGAAAK